MDEQMIHSMKRVNLNSPATNSGAWSHQHNTSGHANSGDAQHHSPETATGQHEKVPEGPSFEETLHKDPSWKQPEYELVCEMVHLLDQYFSDENLMKDKFLLKHVRRNRAGFVSVKLLTSFKKLKYLSKTDWRVTAWAIKHSDRLVLNHQGTKVRRKEPIPQIDLPTTSIKTLLIKLPEYGDVLLDTGEIDAQSGMTVGGVKAEYGIEEISQKLRGFGRLASVKIVRPHKELPPELRNHTTKHPELGLSTCAVIEFEKTEDCQTAYRILSRHIRVMKLAAERAELEERAEQEEAEEYQIGVEFEKPLPAAGAYTGQSEDDDLDDDDPAGRGIHSRLQLPDTVDSSDIQGWSVSLLGSGRNPRRHAKKTGTGEMVGGTGDHRGVPHATVTTPLGSTYNSRSGSPAKGNPRHVGGNVQPGISYRNTVSNTKQVTYGHQPGGQREIGRTQSLSGSNQPTSPLARDTGAQYPPQFDPRGLAVPQTQTGTMPMQVAQPQAGWQGGIQPGYQQDFGNRSRNASGQSMGQQQIRREMTAAINLLKNNIATSPSTSQDAIKFLHSLNVETENPNETGPPIGTTYGSDISDHFGFAHFSPENNQILQQQQFQQQNPQLLTAQGLPLAHSPVSQPLARSVPQDHLVGSPPDRNPGYVTMPLTQPLTQPLAQPQAPTLVTQMAPQMTVMANSPPVAISPYTQPQHGMSIDLGASPLQFSPAAVPQQLTVGSPQMQPQPLQAQQTYLPTTTVAPMVQRMPPMLSPMPNQGIPIVNQQQHLDFIGSPLGFGTSLHTPPALHVGSFPGSIPNTNIQLQNIHQLQMQLRAQQAQPIAQLPPNTSAVPVQHQQQTVQPQNIAPQQQPRYQ